MEEGSWYSVTRQNLIVVTMRVASIYVRGTAVSIFSNFLFWPSLVCLVTQLCPTLCDHMDRSPPGSSVHGDSPGKNTEEGCHALLQGIFPTQGSNPGLPHCRWILYLQSHQGSPKWVYLVVKINCSNTYCKALA